MMMMSKCSLVGRLTNTIIFSNAFAKVSMAPTDPIIGVGQKYLADKDSRKVNLGVGAYRTN